MGIGALGERAGAREREGSGRTGDVKAREVSCVVSASWTSTLPVARGDSAAVHERTTHLLQTLQDPRHSQPVVAPLLEVPQPAQVAARVRRGHFVAEREFACLGVDEGEAVEGEHDAVAAGEEGRKRVSVDVERRGRAERRTTRVGGTWRPGRT